METQVYQRHFKFSYRRCFCTMGSALVIAVLIAACLTISSKQSVEKVSNEQKRDASIQQPWENIRLPDWIIPTKYNISLDVDMENNNYGGRVDIDTYTSSKADLIILHQVNLNITSAEVIDKSNDVSLPISNQFNYLPFEYFVIQMNSKLQKMKEYQIKLQFHGKLETDLSGFYTSFDQSGKSKVGSTFFSPISARKAFPCFDEPKFKANFTVSITHSDQYEALGNMPVQSMKRNDVNKKVTTKFYPSIKMSTYIVCWVISKFDYLALTTKKGLRIKTWAASSELEDTRYGLQITETILDYLEEYFQIPFPLKKLDIVSVPNFGPGAMENWGLITFRSSRLLVNKKTTSEYEKQMAFQIMAHELVHQWFGNLATMKFWTDAWLKEGFANYISIYVGDKLEKKMEFMKFILNSLMLPALEFDSYASSHPISTTASTPNEIRQVFDTITYQKGSCMVQMLQNYLGEENFRRGLQRYLTVYSYKNADQDDLWRELSIASGKDVKPIMDTWTLQLGFPVITVKPINSTHKLVSQQRYSLDSAEAVVPTSPFNYVWQVPILYKGLHNNTTGSFLLTNSEKILPINDDFILNPNHVLYYRVNYDKSFLQQFKTILLKNHKKFSVQDRTGLLSDVFSMVAANLTDVSDAMDITKYLKDECDYYPWKQGLNKLTTMYYLTDDTTIKRKLKSYISDMIEGLVDKYGFGNTSSVNEGLLQVAILNAACSMGIQSVINNATQLYRDWMNGKEIESNLKTTVRHCAIRNGPDEFWDFAYKKYTEGGTEKVNLMYSLSATSSIQNLKKLLNWTLDDTKIDSQDAPYLLGNIAKEGNTARQYAWNLVKDNWPYILERYGNELFLLDRLLSSVLSGFSSDYHLKDIINFFSKKKDVGSGKQAINQSITKIKARIRWKLMNESSLKKWLISQNY